MSKSRANELLQHLVAELTKRWNGEASEIQTSEQAYEVCAKIVEEAKNENPRRTA